LFESGVWILVLEGVLALLILLGIVWWTWPKKK
jgi:cobalamin biosynthesis Mg chelatase CobN